MCHGTAMCRSGRAGTGGKGPRAVAISRTAAEGENADTSVNANANMRYKQKHVRRAGLYTAAAVADMRLQICDGALGKRVFKFNG